MKYEEPNMEILKFTTDDVIRTSLEDKNSGFGDKYDPVNDPDLGW